MLALSLSAFGSDTTPVGLCSRDCSVKQRKLLKEFEKEGVLPERTPAVYSGVCNHSIMYDPAVDHFAVILLDQREGNWNMNGRFSFFATENQYQDWDLETARAELESSTGDWGDILVQDGTARVVITNDEGPAYIYWMRQHPRTGDLLLVSASRSTQKGFCRLKKHQ